MKNAEKLWEGIWAKHRDLKKKKKGDGGDGAGDGGRVEEWRVW